MVIFVVFGLGWGGLARDFQLWVWVWGLALCCTVGLGLGWVSPKFFCGGLGQMSHPMQDPVERADSTMYRKFFCYKQVQNWGSYSILDDRPVG